MHERFLVSIRTLTLETNHHYHYYYFIIGVLYGRSVVRIGMNHRFDVIMSWLRDVFAVFIIPPLDYQVD